MKQIPNLFTLLNLVFGCIAIVLILQTQESIVLLDPNNPASLMMPNLPERIWQGAIFIFAAAIVDFLDGFLARALKAQSELGKQLDSLSDVVSFGVAPGMIRYQLLRISFAYREDGMDISVAWLLPAFLFTAAVAWRLGTFNISYNQSSSFKGVPSPAAGLLVASLPLIIMEETAAGRVVISPYIINEWVLYGLILLLAYLMQSKRTFMAIKFKSFGVKDNLPAYALLVVSVVAILVLHWRAVPLIFALYLILSFFAKEPPAPSAADKATLDVTV